MLSQLFSVDNLLWKNSLILPSYTPFSLVLKLSY